MPAPSFVPRFSRIVLLGFASLCAVVLLASLFAAGGFARPGLLLPLAGVAIALLALRAPLVVRVNLALLLLLGTAGLYLAELVLMPKTNTIRRAAEAAGRRYDPRSKAQFVAELRRAGDDAYPAMHRGATTVRLDDREVVPLGGVSGVTSVMCNERGQYVVFRSDEHGFNNPPGLWSGPVDVAVVGDSYTMGWCVPPEQNLVALLRERFPRTLNLGIGGNGPLTELATLREYLPRVRPRVVVWAYFENDLRDLEEEKGNPLLRRYLTDTAVVGLADRQREIDRQLRSFVDSAVAGLAASDPRSSLAGRALRKLGQVARLHHVRSTVAALRGELAPDEQRATPCCDVLLFADVLARARRTVEGWGGTLYFAFIPTRERYHRAPPIQVSDEELAARDAVLGIADSLGIPVIDVDRALRRHAQPESMYVYPGAHFDVRGYRAAAAALLERIATESPATATRSSSRPRRDERAN